MYKVIKMNGGAIPANDYIHARMTLYSCDLDLDPMTFIIQTWLVWRCNCVCWKWSF